MSITAIVINAFVVFCLTLSLIKDREKTKAALLIAWNATKRLAPSGLAVVAVIGLIVGFIPRWIATSIGGDSGVIGLLIAALLFHPSYRPSSPSRWRNPAGRAGVMAMAVITTLTMIGFIFLPIEIKELGKRFAFLRNGLSLVALSHRRRHGPGWVDGRGRR